MAGVYGKEITAGQSRKRGCGNAMKTILETKRLSLREMTMEDLPALRQIVCDEQTMTALRGAWSEAECLAGLQKQIRGYAERGFGRWAVVLKAAGAVVGMCGLQYCDTGKDSVPEIGYLFNRRYWHNGYATEAAVAVRDYAFNVLQLNEVFSLIKDDNLASINVAIRNGMVVRGRFVKHDKGADTPHFIFSIRKSEAAASGFGWGSPGEARRDLPSTLQI